MPTNELHPEIAVAVSFYDQHYTVMRNFFIERDTRIVIEDSGNRVCRFCGLGRPEATFRNKAHAIPEALGNRGLLSKNECDSCNHFFGSGIEDDFGKWSKPSRTFSRISGKKGIPTLKKGGAEPGWRIQYDSTSLHITAYENDPSFVVDEKRKQIRFELQRDAYTPVAVLKAFVRIGVTLVPAEELPNFSEALAWICEPDHSKSPVAKIPVSWTFLPGPMRNDLIVAILLRRRDSVAELPYAFLVLAYGNDVFQVCLPCPKRDNHLKGRMLWFPLFPSPMRPDPHLYGEPNVEKLDLCGRGIVKGEKIPVALGFDQLVMDDEGLSLPL